MTLADRLLETDNRPSGFDYFRLVLAVSVLAYHSFTIAYGDSGLREILRLWVYPVPYLSKIITLNFGTPVDFIVPCFFALSGFLVGGSLERNTLPSFLALRGLRIFPALCAEVLISALILGPLLTTLPWSEYFSHPQFISYFLNIVGDIHYELPGVFQDLPPPHFVNAQLWTVPYELNCYLALAAFALLGLIRWQTAMIVMVVAASLVATAYNIQEPFGSGGHFVLSFLFGVILYLKREVIPFNGLIALVSFGFAWILLQHPKLVYLSGLPVAYLTVWIGLQNPKRSILTDGADYSYGIYLYSYPVQQSLAYIFPPAREWYANILLGLLCSGVTAYLSWTLIEAPILRQKKAVVSAIDRSILFFRTKNA